MTDAPKMPEPTGDYANVPPGWPPQTWGAHLASLAWMAALGQAHYSFTAPERHIRMFLKRKRGALEEMIFVAATWAWKYDDACPEIGRGPFGETLLDRVLEGSGVTERDFDRKKVLALLEAWRGNRR